MKFDVKFPTIKALMTMLQQRRADVERQEKGAVVSYNTHYAVYVHQNQAANYTKAGTGPQFLQRPADSERQIMGRIVATSLLEGASMLTALIRAGEHLLKESQELVPYDTGALHDSGLVRPE